MTELKVYYDKDANLQDLAGKTYAIIGYGSQGHAHALNLRDSGVNVIIGQRAGGAGFERAKADGWNPMPAAEAAAKADIIHFLLPDELHRPVYENDVRQHLKAGKALVFSHGFNIHFGIVQPPKDVDVYMVAPKGPGHLVRRTFAEGGGVPCLVAVHQNPSGNAMKYALAHASGVGGGRSGILETTFKEETETDLFGEQVVLCGGLTALIQAGFETLVEAGYQPAAAYFECCHELKLIIDLIYEGGIEMMRYSISDTAEYGDLTRGPRIITDETKKEMKRILKEIQEGDFAKEYLAENMIGRPKLNRLRGIYRESQIAEVGSKLRSMMSWLQKGRNQVK